MSKSTKASEVCEALGIGENTNRGTVISALSAKAGPVKRSVLLKRLYGADSSENARKLSLVLLGVKEKVARQSKIKFKQTTDKDSEICFTLSA